MEARRAGAGSCSMAPASHPALSEAAREARATPGKASLLACSEGRRLTEVQQLQPPLAASTVLLQPGPAGEDCCETRRPSAADAHA